MSDRATSTDRQRVLRSAAGVGLWVGGVSAAIVALITAVTVAVVALSSRAEARPGLRAAGWHERIIDIDRVVVLAIVLGGAGVIALGGVAWWAARRASQPLAEALRVQRDFVADAGHELRTPLTTLTSRIQIAQYRAARGGDVDEALTALRRDADALDAVLADLLLSAETAGDRRLRAVPTSVSAAADAASETVRPHAEAGAVALDTDVPAGLEALAEPATLRRALVCLLDNAVRHTPPGGHVLVRARRAGRMLEIRVVDDGSGITGIARRRVFDRFAGTGGRDDRGGTGLGLALVRDIATRFRGTVRVERTSPSGTTLLLRLPAAPATREVSLAP